MTRNNGSNEFHHQHSTTVKKDGDFTTRISSHLTSNWRRVASTHSLEDLLREKETSLSSGGNGTIEGGAAAAFIQQVAACMAIGCGLIVLGCSALLVLVRIACDHQPSRHRYGFLHYYPMSDGSDYYYYLVMVPLLLPVTVAYIAANWFSMKIFKHNSSSSSSCSVECKSFL